MIKDARHEIVIFRDEIVMIGVLLLFPLSGIDKC